MYGFKILDKRSTKEDRWRLDFVEVACAVHDQDLVDRLEMLIMESQPRRTKNYEHYSNLGIMISHPHGRSKKITVGRILHLTDVMSPKERPLFEPRNTSQWTVCRLPLYPWSNYYTGPVNVASPLQYDALRIYDTEGDKFLSECNSSLVESFVYPMVPGKIFLLPRGIQYFLPMDAEYLSRFHSVTSPWFTLPPNTKFCYRGMRLHFPPEAEFACDSTLDTGSFVTYDMSTCPGSSGASVLQDDGSSVRSTFCHYGSLATCNRSGVQHNISFYNSRPPPSPYYRQKNVERFVRRIEKLHEHESRGSPLDTIDDETAWKKVQEKAKEMKERETYRNRYRDL